MPKVGVHALILNEKNQVLLVQKNYLSRDWTPPGGMMEEGESLPETAIREVLEETGYLIETQELVAIGSRPQNNDVIIVLSGKILQKKISAAIDPNEISEIGFYSFDQLPEPMKPETKRLLALFQQGLRGQLLLV